MYLSLWFTDNFTAARNLKKKTFDLMKISSLVAHL